MNIGLLGGTFDPIHLGHVDVARAAHRVLALDQVWIVPARTPPHRHHPVASAAHRFAMATLAIAGEASMRVSDVEMDQLGPSYTIDTFDRLGVGTGSRHRFVFISGADAFKDIPSWKAYPAILDRCHFAVVSRPGLPCHALPQLLPDLAPRMLEAPCPFPLNPSIFLVDVPTAAVSSTNVRHALAAHRPLDGLVPPPVAAHISRHGLYQEPTEHTHR